MVNQEDDVASENPSDQNEVVKNHEPQVITEKVEKKGQKKVNKEVS